MFFTAWIKFRNLVNLHCTLPLCKFWRYCKLSDLPKINEYMSLKRVYFFFVWLKVSKMEKKKLLLKWKIYFLNYGKNRECKTMKNILLTTLYVYNKYGQKVRIFANIFCGSSTLFIRGLVIMVLTNFKHLTDCCTTSFLYPVILLFVFITAKSS